MDGKEKVLATFKEHCEQKPHWKIYYGYQPGGSNLANTTETYSGDLDSKVSLEKLNTALELLEPGEYLIQFKDSPKAQQNIINCRFKMGYAANTQPTQIGGPIKGYLDANTVDQIITARIGASEANFEKKWAQREMEELRKEVKELKKNRGSSGELMTGINQALMIFKGLSGAGGPEVVAQPVVMNGPKMRVAASNDEQAVRNRFFKSKYDQAITEIFEAEGGSENGIVLLWCVNEWRKENPDTWNTLKPTILKYQEKIKEEPDEEDET